MNIYKLLKLNQSIKNHRIKFLGILILNILNKRYLSIQFDPVLACNLRCKMCYFTDAELLKKLKGIFKKEDLENIARVNFKNALRLQIGCGAEPTLFKYNLELIQLAKTYKISHISMVTNGNLLSESDVQSFSKNGLNEFIISMHGVNKSSYEDFMDKASYEKFHEVLTYISTEKKSNSNLKLRINYTFNEDNFEELNSFFQKYGQYAIDIIQLRPIDKIGNTTYNNFSLNKIEPIYKKTIEYLSNEAKNRKIIFLSPVSIERKENLNSVKSANNSAYLVPYVNCYISPDFFWKKDFDWRNQSFTQWKKQNNWHRILFKNIFISKKKLESINRNMLNYNVDFN
jgi:molybdenum cofactor biosynthesis enzyme MoaA